MPTAELLLCLPSQLPTHRADHVLCSQLFCHLAGQLRRQAPLHVDACQLLQLLGTRLWALGLLLPLLLNVSQLRVPLAGHADVLATGHAEGACHQASHA
jgi:hypothetical protein